MEPEDSLLLKLMTEKVNGAITRGETTKEEFDPFEYASDCLDELPDLAPTTHAKFVHKVAGRATQRRRRENRTRKGITKRFGLAFLAFEESLAAAEILNDSLIEAVVKWMRSDDHGDSIFLLGLEDSVGGKLGKFLLLHGMQAQMNLIAHEVLVLLKAGLPAGAAARARTLHEMLVKAALICSDSSPSGAELADRYIVSAQIEAHGRRPEEAELDDSDLKTVQAARAAWGDSFFRSENNWALPAIGRQGGSNVTFKEMEAAAQADALRHMYKEGNSAIHVGSKSVIQSTDYRTKYLHTSRPELNVWTSGRIGQATTFYLKVATLTISHTVCKETKEWDNVLPASEFVRCVDRANSEFYRLYANRAAKR